MRLLFLVSLWGYPRFIDIKKVRISGPDHRLSNPLIVRSLAQVSTFLQMNRGCRVSQILCISTTLNKRNTLYGLFLRILKYDSQGQKSSA